MTDERKPAPKVEASIEVNALLDAVAKGLTDGEEPARWLAHSQRPFPGSNPPAPPGDAATAQ